MPGFDGTGPRGRGPFTGHGRGFCVLDLHERPARWSELAQLTADVQRAKDRLAQLQRRIQTRTQSR